MKKLLAALLILSFTSCTGFMNKKNPIHTTDIYSGKYHDLMDAADAEDLPKMEKIVQENSLQLNYADTSGVSLLNWCIFNNKPKAFAQLLALGADPNWQTPQVKFAPAIIEAAQAFPTDEFLKTALQHYADVNCRSKGLQGSQNQAPLQAAVFSGELARVQLLVEKGADVNYDADTAYNWLPLTDAIILQHLDIAGYLLAHGADPGRVQFKKNDGSVLTARQLLNECDLKNDAEKEKQRAAILAMLPQ